MAASTEDPLYDTAGGYESSDVEEDENEQSLKFDILPELQQQLEQIIWFHPYLSRHQSDSLLRAAEEGVYLLRKRRKGWGLYSLDIKYKLSVKHFPVTLTENGILMGGGRLFPTAPIFIEHFKSTPLLGDESGSFVECKYPYPREVHEFDMYHTVTCHFLYGDIESDDDEQDMTLVGYSAASKEGYIRKQGGIRKSWKTRWFVLKDSHIAYFPNHKSKKAIRILKLDEIVHVLGDDSTKHFRIVLPWRTFFLEAPTPQSKKEWVDILRWKLEEFKKKKKPTTKGSTKP